MNYYVVMIQYNRRVRGDGSIQPAGHEAIVDPDISRREVISRIVSGEYQHINFIHHIDGGLVEDVTDELVDEAENQPANELVRDNAQFGVGA